MHFFTLILIVKSQQNRIELVTRPGCFEELEDCESSYAGGADGQDGHGESSKGTYGHGTGDDLRSFHFENFALTPGVTID